MFVYIFEANSGFLQNCPHIQINEFQLSRHDDYFLWIWASILKSNPKLKLMKMIKMLPVIRVGHIFRKNLNEVSPYICRCTNFPKFKQTSSKPSDGSTSEQSEEAFSNDKHSAIMKINISNTRVDLIIKSGLGIARNKIEKLFYENKIRVNGQKIDKKSEQVEEGDEIDVIKGPSPNNPDFLIVARVEVLSMKPADDTIAVKIRRCKSLLVENKLY